MKFSILIPHFKVGKMTAYTIAQLLKYKGKHEIEIIVIDNNSDDGSAKYLEPFKDQYTYVPYPKEMLQSHGLAYELALELGYVKNEYFITLESDSFPTQSDWLDLYVDIISKGFDGGGSLLKLSGGEYMHPAGAFFKKSIWREAKKYCDNIPYSYFPNMAKKEDFDCHLMVHNSILLSFCENPEDYVELSKSYTPFSITEATKKLEHYLPVKGVFHNGMGGLQESVKTYGNRNLINDVPNVLLENKRKLIHRIGYEPGQWFCYWQCAVNKKLYFIPTKTVWLPNRENQQQEYTLMENGLHHCWGISSYTERNGEDVQDIVRAKRGIPDMLYDTLPEHQKIKQ